VNSVFELHGPLPVQSPDCDLIVIHFRHPKEMASRIWTDILVHALSVLTTPDRTRESQSRYSSVSAFLVERWSLPDFINYKRRFD
jgi:hypothetical protein